MRGGAGSTRSCEATLTLIFRALRPVPEGRKEPLVTIGAGSQKSDSFSTIGFNLSANPDRRRDWRSSFRTRRNASKIDENWKLLCEIMACAAAVIARQRPNREPSDVAVRLVQKCIGVGELEDLRVGAPLPPPGPSSAGLAAGLHRATRIAFREFSGSHPCRVVFFVGLGFGRSLNPKLLPSTLPHLRVAICRPSPSGAVAGDGCIVILLEVFLINAVIRWRWAEPPRIAQPNHPDPSRHSLERPGAQTYRRAGKLCLYLS
jgi:hypothetical protein